MTVRQLKEILNEADENLEVLVYDNENTLYNIDVLNVGEVTFQGACDEQGNLIPDGMDKKYDVQSFMIQLKEAKDLGINNLVQLNHLQLKQALNGELCYIEHPTKGLCEALPQNVYIKVKELSEESKNIIEKIKQQVKMTENQ